MKHVLASGMMLGSCYQVVRLLGRGGEGSVYLVRHMMTEQLRAAKSVGGGLAGDRMHELNMMKHLRHVSLPQIIDVLEEEDEIWLIMEYIRGTALQKMDRSLLDAEQFFSIAQQLSEVLLYLHTRASPILHLDIKPSNILIRKDGRLVLIDFGTSIEAGEGAEHRHFLGTRGFAAPEQQCEEGSTDVRSDIYGFGAVMYYCLFGEIPGSPSEIQSSCRKRRRFLSWKNGAACLISNCIQEKKEDRFLDSRCLCRTVMRLKRKYLLVRQMKKIVLAVGFLAFVLAFFASALDGEYTAARQENDVREYEKLLETSEGFGFEQACECYEQAYLLCPADEKWMFHLLERITKDCLFETAEETVWKRLFFSEVPGSGETAAELLKERPAVYGELAYRIGLAYWYFYEGPGGKSAAYKWFCEAWLAVKDQEKMPKWGEAAQIHEKIGSYYEKLGRTDVTEGKQAQYMEYWQDLKELWGLEALNQEPQEIRKQAALELLSCVIMKAYELQQGGERESEVRQMIQEVQKFVKQGLQGTEEQEKEGLLLQCEEAEKAVDRVYGAVKTK